MTDLPVSGVAATESVGVGSAPAEPVVCAADVAAAELVAGFVVAGIAEDVGFAATAVASGLVVAELLEHAEARSARGIRHAASTPDRAGRFERFMRMLR